MKFTSATISLAIITAFVALLLAVSLSYFRNGAIDVAYVILLTVVGFVGSLLYSTFVVGRRKK